MFVGVILRNINTTRLCHMKSPVAYIPYILCHHVHLYDAPMVTPLLIHKNLKYQVADLPIRRRHNLVINAWQVF